jgi:hypothetical protein
MRSSSGGRLEPVDEEPGVVAIGAAIDEVDRRATGQRDVAIADTDPSDRAVEANDDRARFVPGARAGSRRRPRDLDANVPRIVERHRQDLSVRCTAISPARSATVRGPRRPVAPVLVGHKERLARRREEQRRVPADRRTGRRRSVPSSHTVPKWTVRGSSSSAISSFDPSSRQSIRR